MDLEHHGYKINPIAVCNQCDYLSENYDGGQFKCAHTSTDLDMSIDKRIVYILTPKNCPALDNSQLIITLKNAYRYVSGDDSIGSDELLSRLVDTLCEEIGDKDFQEWIKKQTWK